MIGPLLELEARIRGKDSPLLFFAFPIPFVRDGECILFPFRSAKGGGENSLMTAIGSSSQIVKTVLEESHPNLKKTNKQGTIHQTVGRNHLGTEAPIA